MNYKEEVLKVYPDARAEQGNRGFWYIVNNGIPISALAHEEDYAWEHVVVTIHVPEPTPTTITVTGCGDCILSNYDSEYDVYMCNHPKGATVEDYSGDKGSAELFSTCPLKTSPITIMIKP